MPDLKALLARLRPYLPAVLAVVLALFSGAGIAIVITDDNPSTPDKTITIVKPPHEGQQLVNPPGPLGAVALDSDHQRSAADELASQNESRARGDNPATAANPVDVHEDMVDETPPGISAKRVEAGKEKSEQLARQTLKPPAPPAGAQGYSCPNAFVRNYSSLSQRRVGVALHFTVSPPGSLLGIRSLFNNSASGVSSNYGIELAGRCQHWVPNGKKAWAQGAANSAYVSIEIVTYDRSRAQWLAAPIIKRGTLAELVGDILKSEGAPARLVDPSGCTWPAGVTDHDRLECGNNHWDVGKNFPWSTFMAQVRRARGGRSVVSKPSILTKNEAKIIRGAARPKGSGHSRRYWCQRNAAARAKLTRLDHYKTRHRGARRHALGKSFEKRCR